MSSSFASFFTSANQHDDTTDAASRLTGDGMVGAAAAAAGGAATESEGDDEDEEDVDVEDLLWAAQMDLIGHRHQPAISKLHRAVGLSSSAACATLGNLLVHGLRDTHGDHCSPTHEHPPKQASLGSTSSASGSSAASKRPPTFRTQSSCSFDRASREDTVAAAELFMKGLAFELDKPVQSKRKAEKARMRSAASETEEEGAEGRWFVMDRALDLIVGVTDSYRFGVLYPPEDASDTTDIVQLWARGAELAHQALQHPSIAPPLPIPLSVAPSTSPRPSSVSRARSSARSFAHPTTNVAAPATRARASHRLDPATKLRLTITVHLLYLLALHTWPSDRPRAEAYWNDIVLIGGGGVGTKEGDEMVDRARRRIEGLNTTPGSEPDWQLAKKRGRDRRPAREASGSARDALEEIWEAKREKDQQAAEEAERSKPSKKVSSSSKSSGRQPSNGLDPHDASASFEPSSAITIRASELSADTTNSISTSSTRTPRAGAKFHFAADESLHEDYPSPPRTPPPANTLLSQVEPGGVDHSSSTSFTDEPDSYFPLQPSISPDTSISQVGGGGLDASIISSSSRSGSKAKSAVDVPPARSRTSSFAAHLPSSKLLSRVRSSASISTLPPDFGSRVDRWPASSSAPVSGVTTRPFDGASATITATTSRTGRSRTVSGPDSLLQPGTATKRSGWSTGGGWKSKLSSLRENSIKLVEGLALGRDLAPQPPSAAALLRDVLIKDEESAGPGMMWADALRDPAMESEAEEESEEDRGLARERDQPLKPASVLSREEPTPRAAAPTPSTSGLDDTSPADALPAKQSTAAPTPTTDQPVVVKPTIRRLPSSRSQRSFFDPTTAGPRHPRAAGAPSNPPSPKGSRAAALIAASQRRAFSSPNLLQPGAGGNGEMDPLLKELERKSRVGVRTVCATCGKKGLNFPTSKGGATFCSRDCRLKGVNGKGQI